MRCTSSLILMQRCEYGAYAYFTHMFANSEEHHYAGVMVVGVEAGYLQISLVKT